MKSGPAASSAEHAGGPAGGLAPLVRRDRGEERRRGDDARRRRAGRSRRPPPGGSRGGCTRRAGTGRRTRGCPRRGRRRWTSIGPVEVRGAVAAGRGEQRRRASGRRRAPSTAARSDLRRRCELHPAGSLRFAAMLADSPACSRRRCSPAGRRRRCRAEAAVPGRRSTRRSTLADERCAVTGAVGLVVPDAGPRTSERAAPQSLARGEVVNSLRGRLPSAPRADRRSRADSTLAADRARLPAGGDQPNDRRYPIARRRGRRSGLLTSDSTRIPGLVSIADIARGRAARSSRGRRPARDAPRRSTSGSATTARSRLPAERARGALIVVALALVRPRAAVLALRDRRAREPRCSASLGVSEPWLVVVARRSGRSAPRRSRPACVAARLGARCSPAVDRRLPRRDGDRRRPGSRSRRSGRRRTRASTGSRTCSRRCCSLPRSPARALLGRRLRRRPGFAAAAALALVTVAGSRFGADARRRGRARRRLRRARRRARRRRPARARPRARRRGGAVLSSRPTRSSARATHVGETLRGGPTSCPATSGTASSCRGSAQPTAGRRARRRCRDRHARRPRRLRWLARGRCRSRWLAAIAVSLLVNDSPKDVALGGLVGWLALARCGRPVRHPRYHCAVPSRS